MGRIDFRLDAVDVEDLLKALDRADVPQRRATAALKEGARVLCDEAVRVAPVRTGELEGAIRIGKRRRSFRGSVEVGVFYPDAPYAHLVEGGHGGPKAAPPHPFLKTAADNVGEQVMDAVIEALKKEL